MADASVDALAKKIGVPKVLGVLANEMHQDLTDRHGFARSELTELRDAFDDLLTPSDLVAPCRPCNLDFRGIGFDDECEICALGVTVEAIVGRSGDHVLEPIVLDSGRAARRTIDSDARR